MSKTSLSIKLLEILYSRDVVSISELADRLKTNPRNIPEYKKTLEEAGYYIETVPGRRGGYRLHKMSLFPSVKLTDEEKEALIQSYDYIVARNDFMPGAYHDAMSKLLASNVDVNPKNRDITVIPRFSLAMSSKDLQERYQAISECIAESRVLKINYRSNDNVVRERCVHPYKLYMYNDAWFVLAHCEMADDIRYFKLNRIVSFDKLQRFFRTRYDYTKCEWLDEHGMKKNGDWHDVKLKFTGKYAMVVQDYVYGKDQITECVDENTTVLTLKMQYKDTIPNFVLSFGEFCEVIEPQWLKDEVSAKCNKISGKYS